MSSEETGINQEASFKEQLDQIAVERRKAEQPAQPNPIVEKSTSTQHARMHSCHADFLADLRSH